MDAALSTRDRAIVNAYQGGFPVVADPFEAAARAGDGRHGPPWGRRPQNDSGRPSRPRG